MTRLLLLLLLSMPLAQAQSAVDYYHDAARLYVDGNTDAAERAAEAGLALAPDDARLQALLDRIRQQEQQQDQQQGGAPDQQQQQDQQGSDDGQQGEQGQSQPEDGEEQQDESERLEDENEGPATDRMDQPPEEQQPGREPQDEQGQEDEQQAPTPPEPGEDDGGTAGQSVPVEPGRMTRAEAERILSALGADERALLRNLRRTPARPRRVERDW